MPYIVLYLEREGAERGWGVGVREGDREGGIDPAHRAAIYHLNTAVLRSLVCMCACAYACLFVCVCVLEQVNKAITRTLPHASLSAIINYADNNASEYY